MTTLPAMHDDSHTHVELRLSPGVYPATPDDHTLLVGDNQRSLTVIDLGGVIQIGGVDVTNPDHLDALADRLRQRATCMRERATT